MSSIVNVVGDLSEEIADPGVVTSIQKHVADGCPLAPLVEAVTPDYTPEERPRLIAAMVEKARAVIAHQNELAANDDHDHAHDEGVSCHENKPSRQKGGRPKSPERAARLAAAHVAGVSESTARRDLAKLEPDEVLVPKPPTLESRLRVCIEACKAAHEALTTEATSPEWKQWHLDTLVGSAHHDAFALVEKAEKVLWHLQDKKRSIHRADFDATRAAKKVREDEAKQKSKEEKAQERTAKKIADREARAMNAAMGPDDHVCNGSPCTALGTAPCTKAERIASGGGLKAPKRITVENDAGQVIATGTLPEEEPPPLPPEEEIARTWEEGAAVFGPDGETEDEGAF